MAGTDYDKQDEVHVNTSRPATIDTEDLSVRIHVRVKDFRGMFSHSQQQHSFCPNTPLGVPRTSPSTSPYFSHPKHNSDRYSISFSFSPKQTINGDDIVFGNDFDHPIRERLPPGFGYAFNYVKSWIDPGLEGDPLSDEPWLYGPLLSSVNVLRIGTKVEKLGADENEDEDEIEVVEEGASDDEGHEIRERLQIPKDSKNRMKFFLSDERRQEFEFEEGRNYSFDFFNSYLDFNEFALRLPLGVTMRIVKYWDGQPLRYVQTPVVVSF